MKLERIVDEPSEKERQKRKASFLSGCHLDDIQETEDMSKSGCHGASKEGQVADYRLSCMEKSADKTLVGACTGFEFGVSSGAC